MTRVAGNRSAGADETGFALIAVLWGGMLISAIAAAFAFGARVETRLATLALDHARAGAIADAGVRAGIYALLAPGAIAGWKSDGAAHELRLHGGRARVTLSPASARIDLNRAPDELLRAAVEAAAAGTDVDAEALAEAIHDWRDAGHEPRAAGAEDRDYAAAGLPYGARDAAFADVRELAEVLGVTRELAPRLVRLFTVHSGQPWVDPSAASATVLAAIPDLDPRLLEEFLAARATRRAAGESAPVEMVHGHSRHLASSRAMTVEVLAEGITDNGARAARRVMVRPTPRRRDRPWLVVDWRDVELPPSSGDNGRPDRESTRVAPDSGQRTEQTG